MFERISLISELSSDLINSIGFAEGSLTVKIEAGTEQTSEAALAYMAEALKQQGYEVEIEKI